jgi:hypothetical protein
VLAPLAGREQTGKLSPSRLGAFHHMHQDAPGLVGDVAKWIDACAVHPAPVLSTAAALACCSAVVDGEAVTTTRHIGACPVCAQRDGRRPRGSLKGRSATVRSSP